MASAAAAAAAWARARHRCPLFQHSGNSISSAWNTPTCPITTEVLVFMRRCSAQGNGWWVVDWPDSDFHFSEGVRRLTRVDTGAPLHMSLTDDKLFDNPWIYATQVGWWDLSKAEIARLRRVSAARRVLRRRRFLEPGPGIVARFSRVRWRRRTAARHPCSPRWPNRIPRCMCFTIFATRTGRGFPGRAICAA